MFNERDYLDLLESIVPKPIESDEELDRFTKIAESLSFKEDITIEQKAVLELLILLITTYEDKKYPISHPKPLEYILHLMENRGLTYRDLVPVIGSENLTKLLLNGMLEIDLSMAKALGEFFNTSYKDFL